MKFVWLLENPTEITEKRYKPDHWSIGKVTHLNNGNKIIDIQLFLIFK